MIYDRYPHSKDAYGYCSDVVNSRIVAGKLVIAACQRHLNDLRNDDFEYVFDPIRAEKACSFIELLPHTRGKWAGRKEKIRLEPNQKFFVSSLFGWVDKPGPPTLDYPDGYPGGFRRFRKIYYSVGRKNAKSVIAAGIGLYMFCESGADYAPEIFSGATNEKQAWEVFKPARLMCLKTPELVEHYGVEINAKTLILPESGGKFEPVIGNPGDGASPSNWIVDEYHEHATSGQVDTALSGMGSRDEPVLLVITTAGFDTSTPCWDMYNDCKKMLSGLTSMDDTQLALIYELDGPEGDSPGDDYKDSANWIKANPNLGVSVSEKYIQARVNDAIRNSSKENIVIVKNMNRWVNAKSAWLNSNDWISCGDSELNEEDFLDCECIGSIDLSSKIDMTAFARLYIKITDGVKHYYAFVDHFLPRKTIEDDSENEAYMKWYIDGDLYQCGESEIDYNEIEDHVENFMKACTEMREVTYDPYKCSQLAQGLEKKGALMTEYKQQVQTMTEAMKELEGAIATRRFHHNNCPILNWSAGNVINKIDKKGNYYPDKESYAAKIDGMITVIMAVGRAMFDVEIDESVYDKRGLRTL